jgi:hypothetical protein
MRLLLLPLAISLAAVATAQQSPGSQAQTQLDDLPSMTVQFDSDAGNPLSLPSVVVVDYPFCSSDGTTFLNFLVPPEYSAPAIVGISPKGQVHSYPVSGISELANIKVRSTDADANNLFVLVSAQQADALTKHSFAPGQNPLPPFKNFLLRFPADGSSPEVTQLDIPFRPLRLATFRDGELLLLGVDHLNRTPLLATVDYSGQQLRYIDTGNAFGDSQSIVNSTPLQRRSGIKALLSGAQLNAVFTAAQFAHYKGELLMLLPGSGGVIRVLHRDGQMENIQLHLPVGLEVDSIVPSNEGLFIRATDSAESGKVTLLQANLSDGSILHVVKTPNLSPNNITCIYGGKYFGVRWVGNKADIHPFFVIGSE